MLITLISIVIATLRYTIFEQKTMSTLIDICRGKYVLSV